MWFEKRVSVDYGTLLYVDFIFASLDIIFIFTLSQTPLFYKNYRIKFASHSLQRDACDLVSLGKG